MQAFGPTPAVEGISGYRLVYPLRHMECLNYRVTKNIDKVKPQRARTHKHTITTVCDMCTPTVQYVVCVHLSAMQR